MPDTATFRAIRKPIYEIRVLDKVLYNVAGNDCPAYYIMGEGTGANEMQFNLVSPYQWHMQAGNNG